MRRATARGAGSLLTHFLVACVANCLREVGSGHGVAEAGRVIAHDVGGLLAAVSEHRVQPSSLLRRGPWPSRYGHDVELGLAQSCTAANSRLAARHLGASRVAQLADRPERCKVPPDD